jgi:hypothetical protein
MKSSRFASVTSTRSEFFSFEERFLFILFYVSSGKQSFPSVFIFPKLLDFPYKWHSSRAEPVLTVVLGKIPLSLCRPVKLEYGGLHRVNPLKTKRER